MKKVLLFNPPSALTVYSKSSVRSAVPKLPSMSLAMIAGSLLQDGNVVRIADLMLGDREAPRATRQEIENFRPDAVGVTATTPLFYEAARISDEAKSISKDILTILGGPHASSIPIACLNESSFDIVIAGEGEEAVRGVVRGDDPRSIKGVYCRRDVDGASATQRRERTERMSMDELPMPALGLFDSRNYTCPRVIARNNPVGPIEISRGCVFNCSFCNKTVHGREFRVKSPARVIDEIFALKGLGYREFHVLDDQFTTDIDKAKEICREIIKRGVNMTWNLRTGVRVDRVDQEFLDLAKKAGCYQVGVGFESGNQDLLDAIGKGARVEQASRAAEMIKKAGLEAVGFFMLGLPGETIDTMEETIRFAVNLGLDYAKATILVPFPGTRIYDEFEKAGLIKTRDWSRYNFHDAREIYGHPTLSWDYLNRYYALFHRRFYLRYNYLMRRFWTSLRQGRLLFDLYYGYQTFLGRDS